MTGTIIPLFPGVPGGPEMLVILLIAILLFGANKIPKLARSSGQAIGEFQKGRQQVEEELEQMKDGEIAAEDEESAFAGGGAAETETEATGETGSSTSTETAGSSGTGGSGGSSGGE